MKTRILKTLSLCAVLLVCVASFAYAAITLSSFTATPQLGKVIVKWITETEIDIVGFNLYRSETANGSYTKINNSLIPAQGSSIQGASYTFEDTTVQNGKTYFYKLDAINSSGNSNIYGPVTSGQVELLVREYYLDILDREPDQAGWDSWTNEIKRIMSLGIYVGEGFQSEASLFFNSPEYLNKNKTDTEFVTDLYQTFLQREPDAGGLASWVAQLGAGLTRNMLITQFCYSAEFKNYMTSLFGADTTRPENNLVNDFYRGILGRLPDDGGFNSWLAQMRQAQCSGAQAVEDLSYQISLEFVQSAEYTARNRNNTEYVEDLYNAILRRGADPVGFQAWITNLNNGMTRQQVLQDFTRSPEFQTRVNAVIAAGCLP